MAKSMSHRALDAAFAYIAEHADTLVLCAGAPANVAEALSPAREGGRMLGLAELLPGLGNGDFQVLPGVRSGRRLAVSAREDVTVLASGCADHLAVVGRGSGELLIVTALAEPCEVIEAGTVTLEGFSDEIADPV